MSELEDWAGTLHPPAPPAARIASWVPSVTETLFSLGLGDHVVARTGFCVHPGREVKRVPKIGGTKDPDLVRLAALAPTHLIVNVDENRREDVEAARAFVPQLVVTHPEKALDNVRLYRLLGGIFGRQEHAGILVREFEAAHARLVAATRNLRRESVLYLIWRRPWMTVSPETYIADVLACAAWDVVRTGTSRYPVVAEDALAWRESTRILLSTEPYAFRPRDVAALAMSTGKPVHLVDGEWTSWYGVRAIGGLDALGACRAACAPGDPMRDVRAARERRP